VKTKTEKIGRTLSFSIKMTMIYVLKLKNGNYYVGKSDNPEKRFLEHISGSGSAWTRKYPPVSLHKVFKMKSPLDEDHKVKKLMLKHGIDSVRGGSYSSISLSEEQKRALKKEFWSAKNMCFRCGRDSHWVEDCYASTDIDGDVIDGYIVWECDYCDEEFEDKDDCARHEKKCKYSGQLMACQICEKMFASIAECSNHSCSDNRPKASVTCYRCGYHGHYSTSCYASYHIRGYPL